MSAVTALTAIAALAFTAKSVNDSARSTSEQIRLLEQGQITERFGRSVDQLGSDRLDVRLGGIYSLARIMADTPSEAHAITAVLCTFVKSHSPRRGGPQRGTLGKVERRTPAADIQAAVSVLAKVPKGVKVDLQGTDLAGVNLQEMDLSGASLANSDLTEANLVGGKLIGTDLSQADLTGANLGSADLTEVNLHGAALNGASLVEATLLRSVMTGTRLRGATANRAVIRESKMMESDLTGAKLIEANLTAADLSYADLSNADVSGAIFDQTVMSGALMTDAVTTQAVGLKLLTPPATPDGPNEETKPVIFELRDGDYIRFNGDSPILATGWGDVGFRQQQQDLTLLYLAKVDSSKTASHGKCLHDMATSHKVDTGSAGIAFCRRENARTIVVVEVTDVSSLNGADPRIGVAVHFATRNTGKAVLLQQGPAAPAGYRYGITVRGFAANSSVTIVCYDSTDPQGFYTFTMTTDAFGGASTQGSCYSGDGPDHWVTADGVPSNHVNWTSGSPPPPSAQRVQTTGVNVNTWSKFANAGGAQGPVIPKNTTVAVSCRVNGFRVANGNTWWYRIASPGWDNNFYASADAFYNNGQNSGSLQGTPWVDPTVPMC